MAMERLNYPTQKPEALLDRIIRATTNENDLVLDCELFTKEASVIEQKAYRDTWGHGLDSYLQWFYETTLLLRELLADGGIYVHLDYHIGHYAKSSLR